MSQGRPKKVRSDAGLKNLPDELQREFAGRLISGDKLSDGQAWLKARGHKAAISTISDWLAWWKAREEHRRDAEAVDAILQSHREKHPGISDEELFAIGQRVFSEMALARKDAKAWTNVQNVSLNEGRGRFDREKFEKEIKLKEKSLALDREKFVETTKGAVEKALDQFAEVVKQNPALRVAYETFRAQVAAAFKEAA